MDGSSRGRALVPVPAAFPQKFVELVDHVPLGRVAAFGEPCPVRLLNTDDPDRPTILEPDQTRPHRAQLELSDLIPVQVDRSQHIRHANTTHRYTHTTPRKPSQTNS